jgi:hypothetical protein
MNRLYQLKRVCCVCGGEATNNLRTPDPKEPNIIAITPVVYRRGNGKGQLKNAPRIQVCENCLAKALTSDRLSWLGDKSATRLWNAIRESLLNRYSASVEAERS